MSLCKFCGGKADWGEGEQKTKYRNEQAYCTNCFASAAPYATKAEAAKAWNRIPVSPDPQAEQRVAEIRKYSGLPFRERNGLVRAGLLRDANKSIHYLLAILDSRPIAQQVHNAGNCEVCAAQQEANEIGGHPVTGHQGVDEND